MNRENELYLESYHRLEDVFREHYGFADPVTKYISDMQEVLALEPGLAESWTPQLASLRELRRLERYLALTEESDGVCSESEFVELELWQTRVSKGQDPLAVYFAARTAGQALGTAGEDRELSETVMEELSPFEILSGEPRLPVPTELAPRTVRQAPGKTILLTLISLGILAVFVVLGSLMWNW